MFLSKTSTTRKELKKQIMNFVIRNRKLNTIKLIFHLLSVYNNSI